ncbi:questin oxidase family protein [Symbioplanes lichenis]|uniref:questin oxidase family protein n=1 Tax=Symbioplanes lichenis TaxID=1629072 RepID=UPI0027394F43|nr:questin oxidase family protein [Actinoplanes lichenis]
MSYDEVLVSLRRTGPERNGWLSNHAPMAAEALTRHGREDLVPRWVDGYRDLLTDAPRGIAPIARDEWRDPLGDPVRTGDWIAYFDREIGEAPWRDVLATWWPRLLPGIAAGATHGVIRVGHAVRALLAEETAPRVAELGQGLAYWAARWQPLAPAGHGPYGRRDPRAALDAVPAIADQRLGIRNRLAQLADLPGWPATAGAIPGDGPVRDRLAAVVAAAVRRHTLYGYGEPVMMVHAATAPAAVLRTLPALPVALHAPSLAAAWAACAAVTAAYSPAVPEPPGAAFSHDVASSRDAAFSHDVAFSSDATFSHDVAFSPDAASFSHEAVLDEAVASGDAHAIKFADAAVEAWTRAPDPALLTAARHATELISPRA